MRSPASCFVGVRLDTSDMDGAGAVCLDVCLFREVLEPVFQRFMLFVVDIIHLASSQV